MALRARLAVRFPLLLPLGHPRRRGQLRWWWLQDRVTLTGPQRRPRLSFVLHLVIIGGYPDGLAFVKFFLELISGRGQPCHPFRWLGRVV